MDGDHPVIAQAVGVVGVFAIVDQAVPLAIVKIEPAAPVADPEIARIVAQVFADGIDLVDRQAVLRRGRGNRYKVILIRRIAIESVDPGAGPDPAPAVAQEGAHQPQRLSAEGIALVVLRRTGLRIKVIDPVAIADPKVTVRGRQHRPDPIMSQAGGIFRIVGIAAEAFVPGIEAVEASRVGADPDRAPGVFSDCHHVIMAEAARQGVIDRVVGKFIAPGIVLIDSPAVGADPDRASLIRKGRLDDVVAEAALVDRVMAEGDKVRFRRVETQHAGAGGADPEVAGFILGNRRNHLLRPFREPRRVRGKAGDLPAGYIDMMQAALIAAHPEIAVAVLGDAENRVPGQAGGVFRIMLKDLGCAAFRVEADQAAAAGADPQISIPVGLQGQDAVARVGGGGIEQNRFDPLCLRVDAVQSAAAGAGPDIAPAVLADRADVIFADALAV